MDIDLTSWGQTLLQQEYDTRVTPQCPANDTGNIFPQSVEERLWAAAKHVCEHETEVPIDSERSDAAPRAYEDGETTIEEGEVALVFDADGVVCDAVIKPGNVEVPAGGTVLRVVCGNMQTHADAAAGRVKAAMEAYAEPRKKRRGRAAGSAAGSAAGEATAEDPTKEQEAQLLKELTAVAIDELHFCAVSRRRCTGMLARYACCHVAHSPLTA